MNNHAVLDSNEHAHDSTLKPRLEKVFPHIEVAKLGESSGDLWVSTEIGNLIFERKETPNDLLASLEDGRLFRQAETIPPLCRFGFVVLDGDLKYTSDGRVQSVGRHGYGPTAWTRSRVQGALLRAQAFGVLVYSTDDYVEAVRLLVNWATTVQPVGLTRRALLKNPFNATERSQIEFISALPGVGVKRATKAVEYAKTNALNLSELLHAIKVGHVFGPGLTQQINNFLTQ